MIFRRNFLLKAALMKKPYLLISVNGQTGTGNRKLHNKHHEQDDHILSISVKEQQQIHTLYKVNIILLTASVNNHCTLVESVCWRAVCTVSAWLTTVWNTMLLWILLHMHTWMENGFSKTLRWRERTVIGSKTQTNVTYLQSPCKYSTLFLLHHYIENVLLVLM